VTVVAIVENHKLQWQGEALLNAGETSDMNVCEYNEQCAPAAPPIHFQAFTSNPAVHRDWFAVFTRSHHEKCVVQHLTDRGIQSFLPLYKTVHEWSHYRKAALELPLFPNYLFVHIAAHERIRTLEVAGVLSLVGQGHAAARLPEAEIECLRAGLHLRKFEPHPYLAAGARVRITKGALSGMEGVVLRRKGSIRVVLTVDLILQSVAVEVGADELEPCTLHTRN
jgi:transcription antitermination factor NusG